MGFIQHIPGTQPVVPPQRHPKAKGVGVLGLHEGRTLMIALATRCAHAYPAAGCDVSEEKLAATRAELPDCFYTSSYEDMLARADVAIVAIYTPDAMHADHIEQAFEAGKDVICTKPLVNSLEGARRVLEAGRRTGRKLLVGQSTRFFEPFRRQRAELEAGRYGGLAGVELVDAHYIHRMDWYYRKSPWVATDTDWAFLGMSHPVDLVRWYLGRIVEVTAHGRRSQMGAQFGLVGNDIYAASFVAEDGRIGRAMGHYGCHELPRARNCIELMVYGSGGTSLAQYHDMRYVHTGEESDEATKRRSDGGEGKEAQRHKGGEGKEAQRHKGGEGTEAQRHKGTKGEGAGRAAGARGASPSSLRRSVASSLPGSFAPGALAEIVEDYLYAGRHYYFGSEVHGMHYGEFANYADYFARSLIEGWEASPGLEEGVETYCVMEAMKRSADGGGERVEVTPLLVEVGLVE